MVRDLQWSALFLLLTTISACRKDNCVNAPSYRLHRVEYFDSTGTATGGFKKLFYTDDKLTRIEMISGNSQYLEYEADRVVTFNNRLLGVPFPITSLKLEYTPSGQIIQVVTASNGVSGQGTQADSMSFVWAGPRLLEVNCKNVELTGRIVFEEKLTYQYSGHNIIRCVFNGSFHAYTAGPVHWKDSVEFQYNTAANRFKKDGYSFFLQEFGLIKHRSLRGVAYFDPFYFDPALLAFIKSENEVISMKSSGGRNVDRFNYIQGTGDLSEKLIEIRINDRVASRYFYQKN